MLRNETHVIYGLYIIYHAGSVIPMLACMLIYYKCLHKETIPTCLPLSYWLPCVHADPHKDPTSRLELYVCATYLVDASLVI